MIRETADTTTHDTWWNNLHVALRHDPSLIDYPPRDRSPFDPDTDYPEYNGPVAESPNPVYGAVRATLAMLALDEPSAGTPDWNPLKGLVEPGMNVVIKPNLVADTLGPDADLSALFTSMSVIRPLIDYVQKALRGQGAITLGDAPIQRTDWDNLMALSGIAESIDRLNDRHDVPIRMVDFRREVTRRDAFGMVVHRELRDAVDYVEVDLARGSTLTPVTNGEGRFRVSQYDPTALQRHHNGTRNSYMIHRCVLDADDVIGVPKLKVHKKAGITCGLKNLVGIVCGKDWLPHYRIGDAQTRAGDQYEGKSRL
ncbi:MAG: DUF362 domain-containing protein, partial [Phycisphaerae bacterium]